MNQKIVDKIEEIKKLYFEYKNLEKQRKSEEDLIHTKLVQELHDADVIHITCNHGAVLEKEQSESEIKYNYPKKYLCGACKNDVDLYYGYYLTSAERELVGNRYKENTKVDELRKSMYSTIEKWGQVKKQIVTIVIENLRQNKLINTCKHKLVKDSQEKDFGYCEICKQYVSNERQKFPELIEHTDTRIVEQSLNALPVDTDHYDNIEKCFKNMGELEK